MGNHQSHTTVLWAWEYRDDAPAPPVEVRGLEALLNTVDHHRFGPHADKPDPQRDQLSEAAAAKRWLVDRHLLEPHHDVTADDAAAVRAFRDGLRTHLEDRDGGRESTPAWPPPTLRLQARIHPDTGELDLTAASPGAGSALERLLAAAVIAQAKGSLQRLKICAASDCRFAYYDHSRSRSSRWCSMQTCGNRIKTRNYRQRKR